MRTHRLRVCLDARLRTGVSGGVEQAIIGLAHGLSRLDDGDEEYFFLTYPDSDAWIRPYISGPCRILHARSSSRQTEILRILRHALPSSRALLSRLRERVDLRTRLGTFVAPVSDGTIEQANMDIMHFTHQNGFRTKITSIYQPWDLQHLHLPEFFTPQQRWTRELLYRALCVQARMVIVASEWTKQDLIEHYGDIAKEIQVIPMSPVLGAYPEPTSDDLSTIRRKFALPERFVFYPSQTWPHKNHLALLDALAILRDRYGLTPPFVSSGKLNGFFPTIERRIHALHLTGEVQFLDFVSPLEMQALYRLCTCLVFPSKFEGWGFPITEAFLAGVPVASSNVTCLPDVVGDAAMLFDPDDPEEIADSLKQLWTNDGLRAELVMRGYRRVAGWSGDRTARTMRAHYRRLGDRPLTEEDRELLATPSIV
jgi:glycosyltransferase involved in cell wall biosynthesis